MLHVIIVVVAPIVVTVDIVICIISQFGSPAIKASGKAFLRKWGISDKRREKLFRQSSEQMGKPETIESMVCSRNGKKPRLVGTSRARKTLVGSWDWGRNWKPDPLWSWRSCSRFVLYSKISGQLWKLFFFVFFHMNNFIFWLLYTLKCAPSPKV